MDKIFNNRLSAILSVLCLGLSLCGCALSKDDPDLPPLVGCDFGYSLDGMESVSTRTVLTGSDIEDRITCITLAAYGAEGVLSSSRHFEDDEVQSMSLDLVKGEVYDIFALVNMGDMTDELPSFVKDVSSIGYDVPSYSEVDSRGLPMSGSLSGFIPGDRPSAVVPLRRLFAKVTAELALAYDDASITDVYIRNLNGTLSVFGESAASSSADILSDVEYSSASGSYGSYVFYVPENRQGVIGSASDSHGKNPDLDQAIAAVSDRLTYMEVGVALDGRDYAGEVTYRSYLGSDAVKDFDVVGNKRYVWRVTYLEDNLQYDDWKVETGDMNVFDYVLEVVPGELAVNVGETGTLNAYFYKLTDGVRDSGTDVTSSAQWNSQKTSVASVSKGQVLGVSKGESVVTATYDGVSATSRVVVDDVVTYELEVVPDNASISWNETVDLKALFWTVVNGERTESEDVTAAAQWSSENSSVASVMLGSVLGRKGGSSVITASYSDASGNTYSGSSLVTVGDVVTYELVVTPETASLKWNESVTLKAVYNTIVNGQVSSSVDVTSKAQWSSSAVSVATVSAGKVTGVSGGTATVTASYEGRSDSAEVTVGNVVTYSLVVSPESSSVNVGSSVSLSAVLKTYTNGKETASENVTSKAGWSSSPSGLVTVSSGSVKGEKAGIATVTASYSVNGTSVSGSASVTVSDVIGYELEITPSSSEVKVGSSVALVAKYYKLTNGQRDGGTDVTSKVTWSSSPSGLVTVSSGSVKGVKAGTATVNASYTANGGTVSASATVTVSDVVGYELEITPKSSEVNVGSTVALVAKYYKLTNGIRDGGTDVTSKVTWSSSPSGLVNVSSGSVTGVKAGTATVTASYTANGGTVNASASVKVNDVITYDLVVAPETATVNWNETVSLKATYRTLTNGSVTSTQDVTSSAQWTTSSSSVATVSAGVVTGVSGGKATITAKYSGKSDTASITVNDVYDYELEVTPSSASIDYGEQVSLTATYCTVVNGVRTTSSDVTRSATWKSSNSSVASVSGGTVTGEDGGSATVTATYQGCSDTASISVRDVTTYEVEVTPASAVVNWDETVSLRATEHTVVNGERTSSIDITSSAIWSTADGSVATVLKGVVTGVSGGTVNITAKYGDESDYAVITVRDVTTHEFEVTPSSASIDYGEQVSLTATYWTVVNGVRTTQSDVTSYATWKSDDYTVASVSGGTVTGEGGGSATVTATYDGLSDSALITVRNVTTYELEVTPSTATLYWNETVSLKALYHTLVNGSRTTYRDVTSSASWSSGNSSVATVSSGIVTGRSAGSARITASYQGESDYATVTVKDVVTYRLEVTPESATVHSGGTVMFAAMYYTVTNGVSDSGRRVSSLATWSVVSGSSYASLSSYTATGLKPGTAVIRASYNGCQDDATLTVTDPVPVSVRISTSGPVYIMVSDEAQTYQLSASVSMSDGSTLTSGLTWRSANTSVARVSSSGLVTAEGVGTTTVTASYSSGGVTQSDDVTINVSSLEISPKSATIDYGSSQSYSLTLTRYDGSTSNPAYSCDFEISDPSVASQRSTGSTTFNAIGSGSTYIYVSYSSALVGEGRVGTYLTVRDVETYRSRIEITGGTEVAVGGTLQLGVRKYTDTYVNGVLKSEDTSGTAISVSDVTWSVSSGSSYISVSSSGLVTGKLKSGSLVPKVKAVLKSDTTVSAVKDVTVVDNSAVAPDPGWDDDDNIEL